VTTKFSRPCTIFKLVTVCSCRWSRCCSPGEF